MIIHAEMQLGGGQDVPQDCQLRAVRRQRQSQHQREQKLRLTDSGLRKGILMETDQGLAAAGDAAHAARRH